MTWMRASLAPHLEHLSRLAAVRSGPDPHACAKVTPSSVPMFPQNPHSIRTLAPNRTTSAPVRTCFVDICSR